MKLTCFIQNQRGSLSFSESTALKAVSLIMALTLWITILGFKKEEVRVNVPIVPLLAPGIAVVSNFPHHIQFTMSGPRMVLKNTQKKLQPLHPDWRGNREGTFGIAINEELLGELPNGVIVSNFNPPNLIVKLEEKVEKYVEVRPNLTGSIADNIEIAKMVVSPTKVSVTGTKTALQNLPYVSTEAIDVTGLNKNKEVTVTAEVAESSGLQLSRDKVIKVRIITKKVQR